jgi:outer membrane scaffolding protein for murein synthesis (MipA/OmpV family)
VQLCQTVTCTTTRTVFEAEAHRQVPPQEVPQRDSQGGHQRLLRRRQSRASDAVACPARDKRRCMTVLRVVFGSRAIQQSRVSTERAADVLLNLKRRAWSRLDSTEVPREGGCCT